MALPSLPSDASSPLGPLKTLYPLACMLVGPEEAPDLLLRVYRQAMDLPPAERPDDPEEWLLALLQATRDEETSGTQTAAVPETDTPPSDPLRQEVAQRRVEEVLPAALAACSPQERFLLAVEALGEAEETHASPLAYALDTTPSAARAALWAHLRAILSEPEFAIVDEAVSDTDLLNAVRDLVAARYASVPHTLQSQLRKTVKTARAPDKDSTDDEDRSSSDAPLRDRLPSRPRPRALLFTLLIGALVLAGGIGVWYATQSTPTSSAASTSLIAFSVERADTVTPDMPTNSRTKAEAYVESTWNRQIQAPEIKGARLQGVGRVRTAGGVEIPVLLYADTGDSTRIATFAYSYALVDRIEAAATLNTGVREALARRHQVVSDADEGAKGLLWRDRDDIFVVVAPSLPTDSLRSRLRP